MSTPEESEGAQPFRRSTVLDDLAAAQQPIAPDSRVRHTPADAPPDARGHMLLYFCLAGLLGVVLVIAGVVIGVIAYDERYIYDNPDSLWDVMSWIGFLFFVVGIILVPIAIIGAIAVSITRAVRRRRHA